MSGLLLRLYHELPPGARTAAATLRGLYLRWWRYGPGSERLVAEALERDHWSDDAWRRWQEERLARLLHRAATRVPYYRAQWEARRRAGDAASWEVLEHWPVLGKEPLRQHPRAFLADDCAPRRMFHEQSSGTTGKPIEVWRSRRTVETLYAIAAARTRRWYDVPPDARWARLGGQLVVPAAQRRPPFWVWNAALGQLYMSTYHLAPALIPAYLDALVRYRITMLAGYTSALHALAVEVLRLGRHDLRMRLAVANAEPLPERERETIAAAFQCPVQETYGMAESVAAASECEHGRLHQWPEIGWIEAPDQESGDLVCTGLLNEDMPLIRYRVGDSGSLPRVVEPCSCGRGLPQLSAIAGRTNDLFLTRDGRRVFWLNPVLYGIPVREAQLVQETLDRVRVRYVPAAGFTSAAGHTVTQRLRERLGDVRVQLEEVAVVPRGPNGKFRAIVCALTAEERARALHPADRPEAVA